MECGLGGGEGDWKGIRDKAQGRNSEGASEWDLGKRGRWIVIALTGGLRWVMDAFWRVAVLAGLDSARAIGAALVAVTLPKAAPS